MFADWAYSEAEWTFSYFQGERVVLQLGARLPRELGSYSPTEPGDGCTIFLDEVASTSLKKAL